MKLLVSVVLVACCLSSTSPGASACSCVGAGTVRQELRKAKAVFVGRVVEVYHGSGDDDYPAIVEFEVERYWKGVKTSRVEVLSDYGLLSCAYNGILVKGDRYVVYAYGKKLKVRGCTRTSKVEYATEDLRELGEGKTRVGK